MSRVLLDCASSLVTRAQIIMQPNIIYVLNLLSILHTEVIVGFYSEGVYAWNFIPGWNSSQDEVILVYGEMSVTVYTFFPRLNFIPGWKTGMKFHPGMKKKKKRRVSTSSGDEILKWARFFNFWRMYSSMFSKFNIFEHDESLNIMKHNASL